MHHRTMNEKNKTVFILQSFDDLLYYDDQTYTYHPLVKFSERMISICFFLVDQNDSKLLCVIITMLILLCHGITTSTLPCSLTKWISYTICYLNKSLSQWYIYIIFTVSLSKESNVFDLTDAVKLSAWSIKQNKEDGLFNWHTTKIQ